MKMAAREILRRPKSFLVPVAILLLLALLLLYPSAILDGILEDTSAAIENAPADLIVYTSDANGVILRSQIDGPTRATVEGVAGVAEVASFDVILFGGRVEGEEQAIGFAVQASDQPIAGRVPGPGEAIADDSLRDRIGLREGSEVIIGPLRVPVEVVGFTSGTNLWFAGGLVVDKSTWLATLGQGQVAVAAPPTSDLSAADPASQVPSTVATTTTTTVVDGAAEAPEAAGSPAPGAGTQALLVTAAAGSDLGTVAGAIDEATGGTTQSLTRTDAVRAMPGVEQQEQTFGYIRIVTLTVALVVVGLFLSFMTLERAPLYAVLKAIGASSRQLFVVLILQVVIITVVAVLAAAGVTWALTQIPFELPTTMRPERLVETLLALTTTAVVGSALSLRRVVRVDPADAIG
jgi:putative ABC transport system permease protein